MRAIATCLTWFSQNPLTRCCSCKDSSLLNMVGFMGTHTHTGDSCPLSRKNKLFLVCRRLEFANGRSRTRFGKGFVQASRPSELGNVPEGLAPLSKPKKKIEIPGNSIHWWFACVVSRCPDADSLSACSLPQEKASAWALALQIFHAMPSLRGSEIGVDPT